MEKMKIEEILKTVRPEKLAEVLCRKGWLVFQDEDELLDYMFQNYTLLERMKARLS